MSHDTHSHHAEVYDKTMLGFWFFLVTDFLMFATVFATYAVLRNSTFGGPGPKELFDLSFNLQESFVMLALAVSAGLAGLFAHKEKSTAAVLMFFVTALLALCMAYLEYAEFSRLVESGNSWMRNAFLSAYFTLLGTHWIHLLIGVFMSVVLLLPVLRYGLNDVYLKRLTCLKMFWMFLNVVWIFIFSFVYLMGVL